MYVNHLGLKLHLHFLTSCLILAVEVSIASDSVIPLC